MYTFTVASPSLLFLKRNFAMPIEKNNPLPLLANCRNEDEKRRLTLMYVHSVMYWRVHIRWCVQCHVLVCTHQLVCTLYSVKYWCVQYYSVMYCCVQCHVLLYWCVHISWCVQCQVLVCTVSCTGVYTSAGVYSVMYWCVHISWCVQCQVLVCTLLLPAVYSQCHVFVCIVSCIAVYTSAGSWCVHISWWAQCHVLVCTHLLVCTNQLVCVVTLFLQVACLIQAVKTSNGHPLPNSFRKYSFKLPGQRLVYMHLLMYVFSLFLLLVQLERHIVFLVAKFFSSDGSFLVLLKKSPSKKIRFGRRVTYHSKGLPQYIPNSTVLQSSTNFYPKSLMLYINGFVSTSSTN